MSNTHVGAHPMIPRFIRLFSVPIFLGWIALVVILNVVVPQLEAVGDAHGKAVHRAVVERRHVHRRALRAGEHAARRLHGGDFLDISHWARARQHLRERFVD